MDAWIWVVLGLIVVAVVAVMVMARVERRRRSEQRSERLRNQFGTEYDRVVHGKSRKERRAGEADLEQRQSRRDQLDIHPLAPEVHDRYAREWAQVQLGFVDEPERTVRSAENLVEKVMADRGYPVADDFEGHAALVSVDHPHLVANYRSAHGIYERSIRHEADTEQLRSAIVAYRGLFDELLAEVAPAGESVTAADSVTASSPEG